MVLARIMQQPKTPPAAAVAAASALLDRGWGKPAQPTGQDADLGPQRLVISWRTDPQPNDIKELAATEVEPMTIEHDPAEPALQPVVKAEAG